AEMLPLLAKILKCNISNFFTKNVAKTEMTDDLLEEQLTKIGG
ncbi:XRE family transcriptional regulator, partial [Listeria monocytogenes]|nr:XRE family transcriptional regulator [Listeria monocytogenes]